ncbi:MAG TPA: hypothetical protein VI489_05040 [Candidatus Brocadiaceae bacterium]
MKSYRHRKGVNRTHKDGKPYYYNLKKMTRENDERKMRSAHLEVSEERADEVV